MKRFEYFMLTLAWSAVPWIVYLVLKPAFKDPAEALPHIATIWIIASPFLTVAFLLSLWPYIRKE